MGFYSRLTIYQTLLISVNRMLTTNFPSILNDEKLSGCSDTSEDSSSSEDLEGRVTHKKGWQQTQLVMERNIDSRIEQIKEESSRAAEKFKSFQEESIKKREEIGGLSIEIEAELKRAMEEKKELERQKAAELKRAMEEKKELERQKAAELKRAMEEKKNREVKRQQEIANGWYISEYKWEEGCVMSIWKVGVTKSSRCGCYFLRRESFIKEEWANCGKPKYGRKIIIERNRITGETRPFVHDLSSEHEKDFFIEDKSPTIVKGNYKG